MCFFSPDGDLDIQERRPRYHGEPRRKRLSFVKDRSPRRSDDWDARSHRSSNRSSNRSSVPENWYREPNPPPPRFLEPRMPGQQPLYGQYPLLGQQAHHGPHPVFGQQPHHGQFPPMIGQHPPHGQDPMFNPQAHHGQPPMLGPQPQFAQPFRPQQPPGGGLMPQQPRPLGPLPPMGYQQPLRGGHANPNDIVQIIEPGRGHHGRRDQHRIEDGPRARMPRNMGDNHRRGRSNHREHRRRDESVYSFDDDDSFASDARLFRRSRSGWGSDSDDSFAAPLRSPQRRDSRFRR